MSLIEINEIVVYESRDTKIDLTSTTETPGLAVFNMMYFRVAGMIRWPELQIEYTSLTTTADIGIYTFPTSPIYTNVTAVEMQDPADENAYKPITEARTENEWLRERRKKSGFPLLYRRNYSSEQKIEFAPAPDTASLTIRIIGDTEPTALTEGLDETIFTTNIADHALAMFICADIANKRGQPNRAIELVQKGAEFLSTIAGKEITPAELSPFIPELAPVPLSPGIANG